MFTSDRPGYKQANKEEKMNQNFKRLMSPGNIGKIRLKNRIVMPAMVTNFATPDGIVTRELIDHYMACAKGGAGLIIVEATFIHASGRVWYQGLGIDDDRCIPGLAGLADAVRQYGCKIAIQLVHGGRQSTTAVSRLDVVAPSSLPCPVTGGIPKEMTTKEVSDMVEAFAQAARRAKQAGFDAVELHAAHGYLISQFFSPNTNHRIDKYGGDIVNRAQIAVEIICRTKQLVGSEFPIIIRINGEDGINGGLTIEDSKAIARILEAAKIDAVHVTSGTHEANANPRAVGTASTMLTPHGHLLKYAAQIKSAVKVPVIAVGGITPELGEQALGDGKADFISIGRGLLADPELPNKLERRERDSIRPCIRCNEMCLNRVPLGTRCTVNSELGYEGYELKAAQKKKKVLVAGGGPAGMEAARIAAQRGHEVILFEKGDQLGGHLIEASVSDFKTDLRNYKEWLVRQMSETGVKVELGKELTPALIADIKPHAVVIATGSLVHRPSIPGIDKPIVASATEVLLGKTSSGNYPIVAGGGAIGCEVALHLVRQCKVVTLVEMLPQIADDVSPIKNALTTLLNDSGVHIYTDSKIVAITDNGVAAISNGQQLINILGDRVVLAMGMVPDTKLYDEIHGKVRQVFVIGDAVMARRVGDAIHEGYRVASII
jgi:2,4-dienoyl-CoA reductase-like NADH-dependent reductase (Old Yellow Enzyme family)/thioredoxin reductase